MSFETIAWSIVGISILFTSLLLEIIIKIYCWLTNQKVPLTAYARRLFFAIGLFGLALGLFLLTYQTFSNDKWPIGLTIGAFTFEGMLSILGICYIRIMLVPYRTEREIKTTKGEKMTTRTERTDEIFWTVILFIFTATYYFLGYIFFVNGKLGFAYLMVILSLAGTILTLAGIRAILIRRFAEREIRKMKKEEEENQ